MNKIIDKHHGRTELHLAAIKGSMYEIRRLIGLGYNPQMEDKYGKTPNMLLMFYHGKDMLNDTPAPKISYDELHQQFQALQRENELQKTRISSLTMQIQASKNLFLQINKKWLYVSTKNEALWTEIQAMKNLIPKKAELKVKEEEFTLKRKRDTDVQGSKQKKQKK